MISARQSPPNIRPEGRLLLLCARVDLDLDVSAQVKLLIKKVEDWKYLLDLASRHGLMPLLSRQLSTLCPEMLPEFAMVRLRNYLRFNTKGNLFLTGELIKLLRIFEANDIQAVPFKGPVLAASVYGNIALREFCDLDILVHKHDVPKVKDVLGRQSYFIPYALTPAQVEVYFKSNCAYTFEREDKKCYVDLHWKVGGGEFPFPLTLEQLTTRLQSTELSGATIKTFSVEDTLIILCTHAAKHLHERLEWLCGIAEIIRQGENINWAWVTKQVGKLHTEKALLFSLGAVQSLFSVELPEDIQRKINVNSKIGIYLSQLHEKLFSDRVVSKGLARTYRLKCMMIDREQDKIKFILKNLVTPKAPDITLLSLPPYLSQLYYGLRQLRLVNKYGRAFAKRIL